MRPLEADEPTVVGPYRLLGRLGSGGMGRVYLGRSAGGRTVAVKIVHPHFALDEEFRARFRREVEAARRVGGAGEGQGAALDGKLPLGTFRLTVQRAELGAELGRLRQTDQLGCVCVDVLTLKQVTDKQLVATSVGAKYNHGGRNPATTTVRLTPVGDDLQYASESKESGRPEARMPKVK